ncbi:MAG: type II 3-dehydroquinate dehydratase [Candidatus Neomarinimicrobiota bacterium]|nr:type II 3-dehydroquinate dehydratase [Candidatus Neomarinimicrobiota bacterium]|tara:strand:- start:433 stop:861 length:429 start_codon:yes stop_codon:yes gene_type:complete
MKVLIINGPNLNLLGLRETDVYGTETLGDIENWLLDSVGSNEHEIDWYQSNHEGEIIDKIHMCIDNYNSIIINPGAYTHYSYAIRDAIISVKIPTVEVHLSDIKNREEFRKHSVIEDICIAQVTGHGKNGYLKAFQILLNYL